MKKQLNTFILFYVSLFLVIAVFGFAKPAYGAVRLNAKNVGAATVTEDDITETTYLERILYRGDAYFCLTNTYVLMRSTDLVNWEAVTKDVSFFFGGDDFKYCNGVYLICSSDYNSYKRSTDGIYWEEYLLEDAGGTIKAYGIYLEDGKFVLGRGFNYRHYYSDDGLEWITLTDELPCEKLTSMVEYTAYVNNQYLTFSLKNPNGNSVQDNKTGAYYYFIYSTTENNLSFPTYAAKSDPAYVSGSALETTGTPINGWKWLSDMPPRHYSVATSINGENYLVYSDENTYDCSISKDLINWKTLTDDEFQVLLHGDINVDEIATTGIHKTNGKQLKLQSTYFSEAIEIEAYDHIITEYIQVSDDNGLTWNSYIPVFWLNGVQLN